MVSNNNVKLLFLSHCLYIAMPPSPPPIKLSALNIMEQLSCSSKSKQALGLCREWPGVTSVKMVRYLIDPENHAINRFTCSYFLRDTHEAVRPSKYAHSQSHAVSESCHFTEALCAIGGGGHHGDEVRPNGSTGP